MRRVLVGLAVVAVALLTAADADAQRAPKLEERVKALETQVGELQQAGATVPTVSAAVQRLTEQIVAVQQQLQTLGSQQKSIPDAVKVLDELGATVTRLESEVASLRTDLASLEQPSDGGGGSGGGGVDYDGGFVLASGDGRYAMVLGGYMQARYQALLNEDFDELDESTLRIRRGRLAAKGHFGSKKLEYKLMFEMVSSSAPLLDYYIDYALHDRVWVRVGQYKTNLSWNYRTSSSKLVFMERPLILESLRYDRDIQVGFHGTAAADKLDWYAGVGNGAGRNKLNDNIDFAISARVNYAVLGDRMDYSYGDLGVSAKPALTVGAGLVYDLVAVPDSIDGIELRTDVDGDGDRDNVRTVSAAASANFRMKGFELALEGMYRHEDWGTILEGQVDAANPDLADVVGTEATRSHYGLSAMGTYVVKPEQLVVGARVAFGEMPFLGVGGRSSSIPLAEQHLEISAVCQLYRRGHRVLGLFYSFTDFHDPDAPEPPEDKDHRIILETQLKF